MLNKTTEIDRDPLERNLSTISNAGKKEYHTAYLYGYVLTIALGGFNIGMGDELS